MARSSLFCEECVAIKQCWIEIPQTLQIKIVLTFEENIFKENDFLKYYR